MRTSRLTTITLLSIAIAGAAVTRPDALTRAERVQPFKRLTVPRIQRKPGPRPSQRPKGLPFDESPTFTNRYMETGGTRGADIMCPGDVSPMCKMLDDSLNATIPMRDRELVILRTA